MTLTFCQRWVADFRLGSLLAVMLPYGIAFFLGGDVNVGEDAVGYAIAAWMIIVMGVAMGLYWLVRKRAERWKA